MKVVLDTNVLISGTFWKGDSFKILELIDNGNLKCFLSKDILKEYYKVLDSKEIIDKIENKKLIIFDVFKKVVDISKIVVPHQKIHFCEDKDDDKILECALESKVDFIITQDNHLLKIKSFKGIKILKPCDFLKYIEY